VFFFVKHQIWTSYCVRFQLWPCPGRVLAFRVIGFSISFCRSARCLTRRCRGLSNLRQIRVGSRPLPAWIPRPRTALSCSVLFDSARVFGLGFYEPVQALISCRWFLPPVSSNSGHGPSQGFFFSSAAAELISSAVKVSVCSSCSCFGPAAEGSHALGFWFPFHPSSFVFPIVWDSWYGSRVVGSKESNFSSVYCVLVMIF
jgi:hypothetical protein